MMYPEYNLAKSIMEARLADHRRSRPRGMGQQGLLIRLARRVVAGLGQALIVLGRRLEGRGPAQTAASAKLTTTSKG